MNDHHVTPTAPSHAGTLGRVAPSTVSEMTAWVHERVRGRYPTILLTAAAVRQLHGTEPVTRPWLQRVSELPPHHFQRIFDALIRGGVLRQHDGVVEVQW